MPRVPYLFHEGCPLHIAGWETQLVCFTRLHRTLSIGGLKTLEFLNLSFISF